MKAYRITAMAAAVLMMAAGCAVNDIERPQPLKPGSSKVFYATMESQTKTTINRDNKTVLWEEADTIAINGIKYVAVQDPDYPERAMFVKAKEESRDAEPVKDVFYATYPSNLYDTVAKKAVLPAVQQYVKAGSLAKVFPMYAESTTENLGFKNICGLLELNLTGDYTVKTITVTDAEAPLSGEFEVDDDNNAKIVEGEPEEGVTLDCGEGVKLDEGTSTSFYIAVPAGEYKQLTITVTTADDKKMVVKTLENAAKVVRNTIYPINPKFMPPYLPGKFTVNSLGQQVYFSPGNLQATYNSSASAYTWGFAANQYDYIGNAAGNTTIDSQQNGSVVDLFGWSTSTNGGTSTTDNYGIKTSTTASDYSGDFYDWGKAVGDGNTWRTLTKDEWVYLFNNHSHKWTSVNGVNGYVIAPDDFSGELANSYADDAALASAGNLVFLPAAGNRSGSTVNKVSERGFYWSSTAKSSNYVYRAYFDSNNVFPDNNDYRDYGYSVRLITKGPEISVESVSLNKSTLELAVGSDETLTATVTPDNATDKSVSWSSSVESVATVDANGKVTAVAVGTATITVTTTDGGKTASCTVTVVKAPEPEYVEIGGVKWATKNLGATTVAGSYTTCYGDLYQWGSVNTLYDGFPWTSATTGSFTWKTGKTDGFVDANREYTGTDAILPDANDVVKQKIGDGWRMPTSAEFQALYEACGGTSTPTAGGSTSTTEKGVYWCDNYDGVAGLLFIAESNGPHLFFPAAGNGTLNFPNNAGSAGYYWSSSLYTDNTNNAYYLFFRSSFVGPQSNNVRYFGFSVRPVKAAAAGDPGNGTEQYKNNSNPDWFSK